MKLKNKIFRVLLTILSKDYKCPKCYYTVQDDWFNCVWCGKKLL